MFWRLQHPAVSTKMGGISSSSVNLHSISNSKVLLQVYVKGGVISVLADKYKCLQGIDDHFVLYLYNSYNGTLTYMWPLSY